MNADPRSLFSSIFGANMQTRLGAMALMILGMLAGCSTTPALNVEPVDVKGVVLLSTGQPATGMFINFFPTSSAQIHLLLPSCRSWPLRNMRLNVRKSPCSAGWVRSWPGTAEQKLIHAAPCPAMWRRFFLEGTFHWSACHNAGSCSCCGWTLSLLNGWE